MVTAGCWLLFVFLLACRDPAILLHAEFWGEDGWAWFPDAYNHGVRSLIEPEGGYLQTAARTAGLLAQVLPMAWAPTLFAAIAVAVQAIPPAFLVSERMDQAWPNRSARFVFALIWVGLPNTREVYGNLTNLQWHLAALAFLTLLAAPPRTRVVAVRDGVTLLASGLSGPFCILLLPIAAWHAARHPGRLAVGRGSILLGTAVIQALSLWQTWGARSAAGLGAAPGLLARILAQQVILAPFIGQGGMEGLRGWALFQSGLVPVCAVLAALAAAGVALWQGPPLLRAACAWGAIVLTAALLRPQVSNIGDQWAAMALPGVGQRYFYLPMLAWVGVGFGLTGARWAGVRAAGLVMVLLVFAGVGRDWVIPSRQPTGFAALAQQFTALPSGGAMAFPINPFMELIPMILIHR